MPGNDRVLIVGAGPTGLTAAVELARLGFRPRIIDRDAAPTPLSKAVGISSRSLEILEPAGVTERLLAEGVRIRRAHVRFEGRELAVIRFTLLRHRFDFLLSLPQSRTETLMADVLGGLGIEVERRTSLVSLEPRAGSVAVTLEGPGGRMEGDYSHVFGADGVHSTVRKSLGLAFEGHTHERTWSIADVEVPDWPYEPETAQLFLHKGGDIGFIIPIGQNRFRAVSNTDDAMTRIPGDYRVSSVERTDTFEIPVRQAPRYQDGNLFLGGDAAHVQSPVGARGMNLGIEDAAAFARRFAEGGLEGYTRERRPVGRRWIASSERVLGFAQAASPGRVAVRNAAFRLVGHLPALQRFALERAAGLKE